MAAPSPRKAPAKKAAPKRTPEQRQRDNVINFNEFRERAKGLSIPDRRNVEPYVLGPDQGFAEPITAAWPDDLEREIGLINAIRAMDNHVDELAFIDVVRILFGESGFRYILRVFDTQPDKYTLLTGLVLQVLDHFRGQGAGSVPGGTPAS